MSVRTLSLVLAFFLLSALPANAQALDPAPSAEAAFNENKPQTSAQAESTESSFPFLPLSMALFVLLIASPFAIQYFIDFSKEMNAAQKGSPPSKTKS